MYHKSPQMTVIGQCWGRMLPNRDRRVTLKFDSTEPHSNGKNLHNIV